MAHLSEKIPSVETLLEQLISSNEALLIMQMRLYDVNMLLLREQNPDVAIAVEKLHYQGKAATGLPWLTLEKDD